MIVVDTSALMAIVQDEPAGRACQIAIADSDRILISAATMTEALIVGARRSVGDEMVALLTRLDCEIITVTEERATRAADAYSRWGRGVHPARLNFGDCFAYALAREHDCPLLFVGDDFSRTDVTAAVA